MPRGSKEKTIQIPKANTKRIIVRVSGQTSLLVNRFRESSIAAIEGDQTGTGKVKKAARNPEEEFNQSRHLSNLGDGLVDCFPSTALKKAAVKAGFRFGGEKGTELRGSFNITQEYLQIQQRPGSTEANFPRLRKDVVFLQGRTATLAYRPEYVDWYMDIPITFNANFISMDQIVNLFRLAGESVGIGAWRVESDGTNGQFVVTEVTEIQEAAAIVEVAKAAAA